VSPVGPEGTVKHDDALGRLVLEWQGQEDLRRNSFQSQNREVPKAEPLSSVNGGRRLRDLRRHKKVTGRLVPVKNG